MSQAGFRDISWILLLAFSALSVLFFVLLVVVRVSRDSLEHRRSRRAAEVRDHIFSLVMDDEEEARDALGSLTIVTGRRWDRTEEQIFAVLPKIKGESRDVLVTLLLAKGAEGRAATLCRSRSAVRRCRGAHQLGFLGLVAHFEQLVDLLSDRTFLVRRVAVRALGNMGDARAVRPLLVLGEHDNRLTRDLVYALGRLGPGATEELQSVLMDEMSAGEHLHLDPAAVVLGLIGDRKSLPVLTAGLESENPSFAGSCAEAIGRIGSPGSIPPLKAALLDYRPNVRAAAAHALGRVGSPAAMQNLIDVVDEEEPQVSRQAAQSLLELGPAARNLLVGSRSPYAVEALALQDIKTRR